MQYLLTKEEYDLLISRPTQQELMKAKENAAHAGILLKPFLKCWELQGDYGYCDDCPLQFNKDACASYREYSK